MEHSHFLEFVDSIERGDVRRGSDSSLRSDVTLKTKKKRKERKSDEEMNMILERLTTVPKKTIKMEDLDIGTLRPLVDLAYWSSFNEVRRDAAAAFATLAMNEKNLVVLSEAGALGAVIALIGLTRKEKDSVIQKDATLALSFLLRLGDVKKRFMRSPDGLKSLFYACRSTSIEVRRGCSRVFAELAKSKEAKEQLVERGGIKYLFLLTRTSDEGVVRKATQVLKRLAACPANHEAIANYEYTLQEVIELFLDNCDLQVKRDMISLLTSVSSSAERIAKVVESGALIPLLLHLNPQTSSLETIASVLVCLNVLASNPSVLAHLVDDGIIKAVSKIIFHELKEIRACRFAQERRGVGEDHWESKHEHIEESKPKKGEELSSKPVDAIVELENEALRSGLNILSNISAQEELRDALIESGVAESLLEDSILHARDRKVIRLAGRILENLATSEGEETRQKDLLQAGILHPVRVYLRRDDLGIQTLALKILKNLVISVEVRTDVGGDIELMKRVISLCNVFDDSINEDLALLLARISEERDLVCAIVEAGAVDALTFMISPRCQSLEAKVLSLKALSCMMSEEKVRGELLRSWALGHVISLQKRRRSCEEYARAILAPFREEKSAIAMQMLIRGFLVRSRLKTKKIPNLSKST